MDRPRRTPRGRTRGTDRTTAPAPGSVGSLAPTARARFLAADSYRAEREWTRYEGTPQRDLFRVLRERFLDRHAIDAPWVLDAGSGPGRFTGRLGGPRSRRVALDVSSKMLERIEAHWTDANAAPKRPDRVRGDLASAPFPPGRFGEVVVLGNLVGFAGPDGPAVLESASALVSPEGTLVVEVVPGSGERSRYLARLPPRVVGRLLRSPVRALVPRIEREGFVEEPKRRSEEGGFLRAGPSDLGRWLGPVGWSAVETMAVAPVLGTDAERIAAARADPKAWEHLLDLEEEVGRRTERWDRAAAVLVALRRTRLRAQH